METEFPLRLTEMFWQTAVGAVLSEMVTTAVHEAALPCPSLARSVTELAPKLAQVNELGATLPAFTVPQLSLEAAAFMICEGVMETEFPLKLTEIFWQTTVGTVLSETVTNAVHEAEFP
jgi:tetrahydromethanopterin S-methyltransferase subunit E